MMKKAILLFLLIVFCAPGFAGEAGKNGTAAKPKVKTWDEMSEEERQKAREEYRVHRDNMIKFFNDRLKHRFVPEVRSASVKPAAPRAGDAVTVETTISYPKEKNTEDEITDAWIYYTAPGEKYFDFQEEMKDSGGGRWTAKLEPFDESGKVMYYVQARDSAGNVYSDLPCEVASWPPFDDPCMVSGATDAEPVDDEKIQVEDAYDIWEIRVGMDKEHWYIHQNVEGKVKKGTLNPFHVSMYTAILLDTAMLADLSDIAIFMGQSPESDRARQSKEGMSAWIGYTPLGPMVHPDAPGCWMGVARTDEKQPDTENIKCQADGSDLFFRVKKNRLPETMKTNMTLVGASTGYIENVDVPFPKIREVTNFSRLSWNARSFIVK
ncbi:MAG: hypothetical protein AB1742_06015 [bacterium]